MKLFSYFILSCLGGLICGVTMASTRQQYSEQNLKPADILDDIVDHGKSDIVKTKLDNVDATVSQFYVNNQAHKITSTLDQVKEYISPYVQWIAFIALSFAVILIVYNGSLLVLSPLSPDEASKVKSRMIYIAGGILLVTGFYFIIKIVLAIYYQIFVK